MFNTKMAVMRMTCNWSDYLQLEDIKRKVRVKTIYSAEFRTAVDSPRENCLSPVLYTTRSPLLHLCHYKTCEQSLTAKQSNLERGFIQNIQHHSTIKEAVQLRWSTFCHVLRLPEESPVQKSLEIVVTGSKNYQSWRGCYCTE